MQKGLTKKLDYEKAKLKSKAAQPDYRDRFAQEGERFDRGGSPQKHLTLADSVRGDFSKIRRDDKMKAIEFYTRQLRSLRIKVGAWIFKFKFTSEQFAKENCISIQESQRRLPAVRAVAEEKWRMTLGRVRSARLEGRRLQFRTFLPTVEPIQWSKIYKRVELCPMEQESDG